MSEDIFIIAEGSLRLYTKYQRVDNPRAAVLIVHGLGDHSGRYLDLIEFFERHQISTIRFDLRGNGRSDGKSGYIDSFDDHVSDLRAAEDYFYQRTVGLPRFLYGHSMGALVGATFLTRCANRFDGVIYSSGLFKVNEDFSPVLQKMSAVLSRILPSLPTVKIGTDGLSRDPETALESSRDPLRQTHGIRARTGHEVIKATAWMHERLKDIDYPILVLHGADDPLTKPEASQLLYEMSNSNDKLIKIYPNAMHELYHEVIREQVFEDIVDWIAARSADSIDAS